MTERLNHLDEQGAARMVDVSTKPETARKAAAESLIRLSPEAFTAIMEGTVSKGDVLAAARIAGIMATKKVSDLIPLCHPLAITGAEIAFEPGAAESVIRVVATVATTGKTGVEMEALTAAAIAALTVYDMVKAIDRAAVIESVRLLAKSGGESGNFAPSTRAGAPRCSTALHASPREVAPRVASRHERAKPHVIMGEVIGPRPAPDANREAFRAFMTRNRLRATTWAKDAGVPVGEILSFLTGRSREISAKTAAKLAHAARVQPEKMFE